MAFRPRKRDGVITVQVTEGGVSASLQQYPTDIDVTAHGCQHEWRASLGVATVKRRAAFEIRHDCSHNTRG
nr:hypothetical protein [Elioraea sp.]